MTIFVPKFVDIKLGLFGRLRSLSSVVNGFSCTAMVLTFMQL